MRQEVVHVQLGTALSSGVSDQMGWPGVVEKAWGE